MWNYWFFKATEYNNYSLILVDSNIVLIDIQNHQYIVLTLHIKVKVNRLKGTLSKGQPVDPPLLVRG